MHVVWKNFLNLKIDPAMKSIYIFACIALFGLSGCMSMYNRNPQTIVKDGTHVIRLSERKIQLSFSHPIVPPNVQQAYLYQQIGAQTLEFGFEKALVLGSRQDVDSRYVKTRQGEYLVIPPETLFQRESFVAYRGHDEHFYGAGENRNSVTIQMIHPDEASEIPDELLIDAKAAASTELTLSAEQKMIQRYSRAFLGATGASLIVMLLFIAAASN